MKKKREGIRGGGGDRLHWRVQGSSLPAVPLSRTGGSYYNNDIYIPEINVQCLLTMDIKVIVTGKMVIILHE